MNELKFILNLSTLYNVRKNTFTPTSVNPLKANPTNRQTHSNNSSATANELFECV